MRLLKVSIPVLLVILVWVSPSWADGPQFNGTCTSISWNANTETDLAGYRLYDRVSLSSSPISIATFGKQITSVTCASLGFNAGQHYLSLSAFDNSGNESQRTTDRPFVIVVANQVIDLRVTVVNATDVTLSFKEVDGGTGAPAKYDVRFATPAIEWGPAPSVTSGTCATPLNGTTVGAQKTCTVTGLTTATAYQFQLVPYRGTAGVDAVYGPLSNIAGATTGGSVPSTTNRTTIASFEFPTDGTLGALWDGGYTESSLAMNDFVVVGGRVRAKVVGNDSVETYNGDFLPNDQWCELTISTLTGSGVSAPRCLLAVGLPGALNGYEFTPLRGVSGRTTRISKWVNGQITELVFENATTWVATDILRAEKVGSLLTLYRNNVSLLSTTDSTYAGGRGGLINFVSVALANSEIDSVKFGSFTSGATVSCECDSP